MHTRSRHERKVCKELTRHSIEAFLPEYRTWSRRRDRRKKIQRPLFPGYLFVQGAMTPGLRLSILQTASVVRIVGSGTRPMPIPDHEVESIRILVEGAGDVSPQPEAQTGHLVQVMEGALSGVVGVVEESHKRRIVVSVELLGRSVSATLDTEAVVPYLDG